MLTGNKTVAILANTINDNIKVWRGVVSDSDLMPKETALRTMEEYVDFYTSKINDKEKVMQNTYKLNELLHRHSIPEKLRSQFVGTCLLALKNGLDYSTPTLTAAQIRTRIREVLENLLNDDLNKAEKLALLNRNVLDNQYVFNFNCGNHVRLGKSYCFSHFIQAKDIEAIVLDDIRAMAQRIVLDEKTIREDFIRHNAELADKAIKSAKKELQTKRKRAEELSRLMQLAYEDRLKGKMPEDICIGFIQKYSEEQKKLEAEIAELEERLTETTNTIQSADEFIRDIKKYLEAPELTREMCYELIDRIIVGGHPKHTGKERVIDIVYKVDIASVLRYKLNKPNK